MIWGKFVVIVTVIPLVISVSDNNGTFFDFTDIQSTIRTDLLFLEQRYRKNNNYKFEDFFWTGSGDGSYDKDEEPWVIEPPKTIYVTTTATATTTVFYGENTTKPSCGEKCESPTYPGTKNIEPTPKQEGEGTTTQETDLDNVIDADQEFWIITVFKTDGKGPELVDLKNSLVKLYKKAFQRQQDLHLGIGNKRRKRVAQVEQQQVKVYIHHVDQKQHNGDKEMEILYHVAVAGKPVSATTAVADMNLVSDEEAKRELGFPILIKAEPYIKPMKAESLSRAKNTWIFIGVSILSLLVLLLLVAFLTLGCTKRKRSQAGLENRRQIFERGVEESDKGVMKTESQLVQNRERSPTYINFQNHPSAETIRSDERSTKSAVYLSPSTSSSTSLDISPLMTVKRNTPPKKPPRPRAAINKTVPIDIVQISKDLYDSESNNDSRRNSEDTIFIENFDPGVVSPKSYLSMPSVKSFPRINNPEPLNKVLEPVSMLHLDMPDDAEIEIRHGHSRLTRHGSIGTNADPGVIGPVVWDIHCRRLQSGEAGRSISVDEGIDDLNKTTGNMTKMRKRFHDLLDDTFSLFGSRMESPVEDCKIGEIKSKSANTGIIRNEDVKQQMKPRPRTSFSRNSDVTTTPKGAWTSIASSPMVRPLSAGIVMPRINVQHIQAEGKFRDSDPAIPLIAAIKTELQKCSLPGSTTDLNK